MLRGDCAPSMGGSWKKRRAGHEMQTKENEGRQIGGVRRQTTHGRRVALNVTHSSESKRSGWRQAGILAVAEKLSWVWVGGHGGVLRGGCAINVGGGREERRGGHRTRVAGHGKRGTVIETEYKQSPEEEIGWT